MLSMEITCPFCQHKTSIEIFKEEGLFQDLIIECEDCAHQIQLSAEWSEELEEFEYFIDKK